MQINAKICENCFDVPCEKINSLENISVYEHVNIKNIKQL